MKALAPGASAPLRTRIIAGTSLSMWLAVLRAAAYLPSSGRRSSIPDDASAPYF